MTLFQTGSLASRMAALSLLVLVIGAVTVLTAGAYVSSLIGLREENRTIRGQIARFERVLAAPREASSETGNMAQELAALTLAHGDHARAGAALQAQLRDLISGAGAMLGQMTLLPAEDEDGIVTLRIQFAGEELTVFEVLGALDAHVPALTVDRVELTAFNEKAGLEVSSRPLRATLQISAALGTQEAL